MNSRAFNRTVRLIAAAIIITAASTRLRADIGTCGGAPTSVPFMDVMNSGFFCQIAEAFFSGLTNGTDASHYSPSANVTREQMAAFITRTLDQSLKRGSKRAALRQFWTTGGFDSVGLTANGGSPQLIKSDGADLWVTNFEGGTAGSGSISRVKASDGSKLGGWVGATGATAILIAMGKVFIGGFTSPGRLYEIDPTHSSFGSPVTMLTNTLGDLPRGIAYDGHHIWTANQTPGSVSIITINSSGPPTVMNVAPGFGTLFGIIYDGANIWVTDDTDSGGRLHKLDSTGTIIQSVNVGSSPHLPAFDGTNIWVPNNGSNSVSVVRATGGLAGTVIATLTGNGLDGPFQAAFDGSRILITNRPGSSVSLWGATDLTPIGTFSVGPNLGPKGVCSDGINFWIVLETSGELVRF